MIGLVLGSLLSMMSPLPAHVDSNRHLQDSPRSDPASVVEMQAFGRCVARHQPKKAATLLRMDFTAPEYNRAMRKLAFGEPSCLQPGIAGVRARFSLVLFAGALAEQLLSRIENLATRLVYDPAKPAVKTFSPTDYMAACASRTASDKVARLFATAATSAAEAAALAELTPTVQRCLPAGQTARFNRPGLRAILATATYRMVEANKAPSTL